MLGLPRPARGMACRGPGAGRWRTVTSARQDVPAGNLAPGEACTNGRKPAAYAGSRRCRRRSLVVLRIVVGLLHDRGRARHRGAPAVVAGPARPGRAARAGADRGGPLAPGRDVEVQADGGVRPAEAAEVDDPRRGSLRHVLGLHHLDLHDHRGLRGPVLPRVRDPRDRAFVRAGVPGGPVRGAGPGRADHLRGDPAPQRPQAGGPGVPVRRVAHRRGLARAGHDLPGHSHAAAVPGRADQHRVLPLPARRVRVADRRALAGSPGLAG